MNDNALRRIAVSDSGFVFDPMTGQTYTLNKTAALILELLKDDRSQEEIVEAITKQFEVDVSRAEKELIQFKAQLREFSILDSTDTQSND